MPILLGEIILDGFEVKAPIAFGGRQAMAVHKLPGGLRIIDAMGPDDSQISWGGILTGSNASPRARAIDAIRVAGAPVLLSWDVFTATVILSDLKLDFQNSWWIPYSIKCTVVVSTEAPSAPGGSTSIIAGVLADLDQVATAPGVAAAIALLNAPYATVSSSQANAAAAIALNDTSTNIGSSIAAADAAMLGDDIALITQAASNLAFLTMAAGYCGRARLNFSDVQA